MSSKIFYFKESYFDDEKKSFGWTLGEYTKEHLKYPNLCDFQTHSKVTEITPYADFDMNFASKVDLPDDDEEAKIRDFVEKAFIGLFTNVNNPDAQVITAYREKGLVRDKDPNKKIYKMSYRLWYRGYKTTRQEMKKVVKQFKPDLTKVPCSDRAVKFTSFFDPTVYDKNRSMNFINKCKNSYDDRILFKTDEEIPDEYFIIQNIPDDAVKAEFIEPVAPVVTKLTRKKTDTKSDAKRVKATADDDLTTICKNAISSLFPNWYRNHEFGSIKQEEKFVSISIKSSFCALSNSEHSGSNPGIFFTLGRKNVTFHCKTCDKTEKKIHDIKELKNLFSKFYTEVADDEPFDYQKAIDIAENGDKKDLLQYLNNFFAKVTETKPVYFCNKITRNSPWNYRKQTDFKTAFNDFEILFPKSKDGMSIAKFWINAPYKQRFKYIEFDPAYIGDIPGEVLNLWRGFKAKKLDSYDMTKVEPILYHLREVLNSGDLKNYEWQVKHFAHIVQKPHKKTGNALGYWNEEEGAGKNTILEWFGEQVIGEDHYCYIHSIEDLTGQFTALHARAIFMILDEAVFAGGHKIHNILKSIITQSLQKHETKGVDAMMMRSYINLFFLSNNPNMIKTGKHCRRYNIKEVSKIHLRDGEYFDKLYALLEQPDTADHFLTYLHSIDISDYRTGCAPMTEEKKAMQIYGMRPLELFAEDLVEGNIVYKKAYSFCDENGNIIDKPDEYYEPGQKYDTTMDILWKKYNDYLRDNVSDKVDGRTKQGFSQEIRRLVQIENQTKDRHNGTKIWLTIASPK